MREVTDDTFRTEVLDAPTPVVVDFWAPWCGPCRSVGSLLEQFESEAAERVRFAKLNVDDNVDVPARFGVLSLPTVILFAGGEPRATVVGARSRAHFAETFAPWL